MNIGIIGQGFVGNAIYQKFKSYYKVRTYDLFIGKRTHDQMDVITKSDVIFVCLPTPMNKDGSCHVDIVNNELKTINDNSNAIVVIKSTVSPGTTEKWNRKYKNISIAFNPEFLTEANAVNDFDNQTRIILGGPRTATNVLKQIYSKVFPKASIIKTSSTYAEMVKYVTNSFLATKVSFANEMYEICNGLDVDWDKVIEYACYDERLGKSHWSVPGPDGDFGFGGHCFPKDINALMDVAFKMGVDPSILMAVDKKNNKVRQNKDWLDMKGRAVI